ncbi:MAG TPA: short-chain dehydrogenase/reductase [Xanthobacteraceae bacterium]|jgi:NAD(P)-dependent dehydrogenase (short-subunit alcohol dehydrogenase family)|nr:short-chain dehydrogenase/reductase [Xanthobacteraceae bacterium]
MDLELKGQSVLITGASKGIGLACAELFAREGAQVIITGRDAARLAVSADTLRASGSEPAIFVGDLGLSADRDRLFAAHPAIDVLINNAGAIPGGNLFDVSLDRWIEAWQLKVFGYIHLTKLYLEAMKRQGSGVIINIIGMAGQEPRWDYVCGAVGNAGLIALTKAVGAKSVDWNVRVVGINPAATRTDRIETLLRKKSLDNVGDEERWRESLATLPFGRLAEPSEIADLALVMASPRASYLSGTVIDVDAGQSNKN